MASRLAIAGLACLAGAFAAAPPRSLAAGASPWPAPPPAYSPRATLHTGSPFRYSPSTVPLKKLVKPKKAVDMVARVLETTLSAEIYRQLLLTEERDRDLAELCVNCVDDRRAFPIAWKPYDL